MIGIQRGDIHIMRYPSRGDRAALENEVPQEAERVIAINGRYPNAQASTQREVLSGSIKLNPKAT
jgi:hypothetical protein